MDNKVVKVWLWVFLVLSTPFLMIGALGSMLFSFAYPFCVPYMLLKWKRVLKWDEYWRWDFEE